MGLSLTDTGFQVRDVCTQGTLRPRDCSFRDVGSQVSPDGPLGTWERQTGPGGRVQGISRLLLCTVPVTLGNPARPVSVHNFGDYYTVRRSAPGVTAVEDRSHRSGTTPPLRSQVRTVGEESLPRHTLSSPGSRRLVYRDPTRGMGFRPGESDSDAKGVQGLPPSSVLRGGDDDVLGDDSTHGVAMRVLHSAETEDGRPWMFQHGRWMDGLCLPRKCHW